MLLASLVLAFLTGPQAAPAADDGAVKTWDNLDVLRRMLVRQIAAKHDAINAAPRKSDDKDGDGDSDVVSSRDGRVVSAGRRADGGAGTADNGSDKSMETVTGAFTRARNYQYYESSLASNGAYAPGLGAIVNVTVPVKAHVVTVEPKSADAKKPPETKSADDEAWERLLRGDDGVSRRVDWLLDADARGKEKPRRELRYDDASVKALKETVIDTVARFGAHLGLGRGERLAIVVTLSTGNVVHEGDGGGGDKKSEPAKGEVVTDSGALEYFSRSGGAYDSIVLDSRTITAGRRFVLQVSGDDLRAHKAGDLERDELVRKIRIDEFTYSASSISGSNNFTWSRTPK